ncbi:hypothetical protein FQR65_LT08842 [Abscondita terminalis]|nr:hypothetical protein FQR65_LT08842 [Abscondita terminalis]
MGYAHQTQIFSNSGYCSFRDNREVCQCVVVKKRLGLDMEKTQKADHQPPRQKLTKKPVLREECEDDSSSEDDDVNALCLYCDERYYNSKCEGCSMCTLCIKRSHDAWLNVDDKDEHYNICGFHVKVPISYIID